MNHMVIALKNVRALGMCIATIFAATWLCLSFFFAGYHSQTDSEYVPTKKKWRQNIYSIRKQKSNMT